MYYIVVYLARNALKFT